MHVVAALTLALAALASLSAVQPARVAAREAVVPFRAGETLTFDVSWSQFLIAGTATSTVVDKKPSDSSTAYYIVAEGRPLPLIARLYALYYKMDSLLDSVTMLSQRSSLYTEEGSRHRTATTRFDRKARRAFFERQAETTAKDDFVVPAGVQDGLATLYALRARAFKAGDRLTVPVVDDGVLYTVAIEASGPERVRVKLGEFEAWNLKVAVTDDKREPVGQNLAVWISTDARRLPVKMQADLPVGNFVLALREAR
jgi:hypothetical protein